MIKSDDLNYLIFKLIKVGNVTNMVNSHEQGALAIFLRLDSLELIFG
jgi:hypothetical protein